MKRERFVYVNCSTLVSTCHLLFSMLNWWQFLGAGLKGVLSKYSTRPREVACVYDWLLMPWTAQHYFFSLQCFVKFWKWTHQSSPAIFLDTHVCRCKVPRHERTHTYSANCSTVTITWRWEEIEIPSHWNRPRWQMDRAMWKAIFCHEPKHWFPSIQLQFIKVMTVWDGAFFFFQLMCLRCWPTILWHVD